MDISTPFIDLTGFIHHTLRGRGIPQNIFRNNPIVLNTIGECIAMVKSLHMSLCYIEENLGYTLSLNISFGKVVQTPNLTNHPVANLNCIIWE